VGDTKFRGVQCESWCVGVIRDFGSSVWAAIFDVTAERVAEFSKLNADLVGTTCFKAALEFRECGEFPQRADVCHHGSAIDFDVLSTAPQAIASIANLHGSQCLCCEKSRDHAQVSAVDRVGSELADEQILSDFSACEEDGAAGFAINAMHCEQFCRVGIGWCSCLSC